MKRIIVLIFTLLFVLFLCYLESEPKVHNYNYKIVYTIFYDSEIKQDSIEGTIVCNEHNKPYYVLESDNDLYVKGMNNHQTTVINVYNDTYKIRVDNFEIYD